jgi:cytochrome b pre-mRNA-processing protein 3
MLNSLFRKDQVRSQAETLYAALAEEARRPVFYAVAGAPDAPEGRFDMLALHLFLAIERLRQEGEAAARLTRLVQEIFFESLDSALREMGVGDLSVGRKIRSLAEAFYGRYAVYSRAVAAEGDELAGAVARNILATDNPAAGRKLALYAREAAARLAVAPIDELPRVVSAFSEISDHVFAAEAR